MSSNRLTQLIEASQIGRRGDALTLTFFRHTITNEILPFNLSKTKELSVKHTLLLSLIATSISVIAVTETNAAASVGQPAPLFTLNDTNGNVINFADYKGKTVVLEWHNPGCPFVKKHYDSSNMQSLQSKYTKDGSNR